MTLRTARTSPASWHAVGRALLADGRYRGTPVLRLEDADHDVVVWAKLEYQLPSGSTKDRVASAILGEAICAGELAPGDLVVEASSGSTSIALAMCCAQIGLPFRAVMPEGVSRERVLMIGRYGGEVELTAPFAGLRGALDRVEEIAVGDGAFAPRQFANRVNLEAHRRGTGAELVDQTGGVLDGFVAGVGTGGTLMGIAHALRDRGSNARVVRAVPSAGGPCGGDPEVSSAIPGVVEGFSDLYRPAEVLLDGEIVVPDAECLTTTRRLCAQGLPVGPSSGLNYAAAVRLGRELGPGAQVGTVFCDRMERYFSTPLFADLAPEDDA
ncbi:cysteine synthase family protein [Patulibacter sp. SYSU D01012]|uniref:PLP-dependent cysteine synthase family protein n=1 Tax=Patulibacter sp. SYSU D01012 TaxID=2817381 RepID=UPI001B313C32|nr:cysteine synthase family protein [Patulibacter sp. SYSU D01012]